MKCNYCQKEATKHVTWTTRVPSRGGFRVLTVHAAACSEHETSVNFLSVLRRHPEACEKKASSR